MLLTCDLVVEHFIEQRLVVGGLQAEIERIRGGGQADGYANLVQVSKQPLSPCTHVQTVSSRMGNNGSVRHCPAGKAWLEDLPRVDGAHVGWLHKHAAECRAALHGDQHSGGTPGLAASTQCDYAMNDS